MTLKIPFTNFYDSDFDSDTESKNFDDTDDLLNEAFIASPSKSISRILDDSSLSHLHAKLNYNDEKEQDKEINDQNINKLPEITEDNLSCQGNKMEITDMVLEKRSSSEKDSNLYSATDFGYLGINAKNRVPPAKRNSNLRLGDLYSEIERIQFSEISEMPYLPKKSEEKPDCIFTSTCLHESQETPKVYDWSKFKKRSFFEMDDESEEMEPKIKVSVSRSDYMYHELSTIPELDSVLMDESRMKSDKCGSFFNNDSKNNEFLKANNLFDIFVNPKSSSSCSVNVVKVMQDEHFEKFLLEPGILEESDLTLITTDFDSLSRFSEISIKQGHCHNYNKIKRLSVPNSPSMISFLEHELSCMNDCTD